VASDTPVLGGDEVGFNASVMHFDGRQKFTAIADQTNYLLEGAYYIHKAKFQPFVKFETQDFVAAVNGTKDINRWGRAPTITSTARTQADGPVHTGLAAERLRHPSEQRVHRASAGVLLLVRLRAGGTRKPGTGRKFRLSPEASCRPPACLKLKEGSCLSGRVEALRAIVGTAQVLTKKVDLVTYSYDATADVPRRIPTWWSCPPIPPRFQQIVDLARTRGIAIYPRGAGTNLSGGAIPLRRGIVLSFQKMNRIVDVDAENLTAIVEPGVVIQELNNAVAPHGLIYPPDPGTVATATMAGRWRKTPAACAG